MKIRKILVANRGEIALRIMKAAKELGCKVVGIYTHDDRFLPQSFFANEAYLLEGQTIQDTYLNIEQILDIARRSKADAIHPGYGFLSENPEFARACQKKGLIFIGPSPENMETMGEKIAAKKAMRERGIPVIPGSEGALASVEEASRIADKTGYPVLLKAVFGGGGRGMRKVEKKEELEGAFHAASREAQNAFGNGALYLEKFFDRARHIEVQILADHHNHLICLGERECSIQRRHQKLCEEAPANHLSPTQRKTLYNMALEGARAVGYQNAGTLEFVQDKEGNFYFMEMNTRLQVEHPVTEMITGVDIVQWQIRIASGEKLRLRQSDISFQGHAIEFRINAEDPYRHFMPTPGKLLDVVLPSGPGIRVDTFLYPHLKIPQKYDSLIAKLIVWAENRSLCLARAASALESFHIRGIPTTIPFHQALLQEKWFQKGEVHIHSLLEHQPALGSALREEEAVAIAFALYHGTASSLHHRPYVSLGWKRAARQEALRV